MAFSLAYLPDLGRGFIKDDYAWVAGSRVTSGTDLLALFTRQDGFYRPLVDQLRVMAADGYLGRPHLDALGIVADAEQFLRFVENYAHPARKWLPAVDAVEP